MIPCNSLISRYGQLCIFVLLQLVAGLVFLIQIRADLWPVWLALTISSTLALGLARFWHDGRWWMLIHAFFLPLVWLMLFMDIDPIFYLMAFALSWLLFGRIAVNRAPLYLSNRRVLEILETHLPHGGRFLDIGAGSGTVLAWLANRRPDLVLTGIEQAWLPWLIGRLRLPGSVKWIRGDYRELDFSHFDAAYAFLSPIPMAALWIKVSAEMQSGTLFLSNTFAIPGIEPDDIIELGDWKNGKLLLWRM